MLTHAHTNNTYPSVVVIYYVCFRPAPRLWTYSTLLLFYCQ